MRLFEDERYQRLAEQLQDDYVTAEPFPHAVIDDFLPAAVCEQLLEEFPKPDQIDWMRFNAHHSKKLATRSDCVLGAMTQQVLAQMNSASCLQFLELLTGITGLLPDPYFEGGGLHQIERGGFLKIHADFNYHSRLRLDRRLNLIVYLNRDWREEYNGHLELWDRSMTYCVRRILPVYNRCVIFSTTDWSFHGHPEPLRCPPGQTRKSLAVYYYSNGRPEEEKSAAHGTMWQERPAAGRVRTTFAGALRSLATVFEGPGRLMRRAAAALGTGTAG
jgi:hypothetical protein